MTGASTVVGGVVVVAAVPTILGGLTSAAAGGVDMVVFLFLVLDKPNKQNCFGVNSFE